MSKKFTSTEHEKVVKEVNGFVRDKWRLSSGSERSSTFSPRPAQIEVKNCTKIDRNVQKDAVSTITKHLLAYSCQIQLNNGKSLTLYDFTCHASENFCWSLPSVFGLTLGG